MGEFRQLPSEEITKDIHCETKWSKLGYHVIPLRDGGLRGKRLGKGA
jgi:hypothetical protein